MKKKLGFAAMSAEKQREIARQGGRSVPAEKRSFATDPDLAKRAARKGGHSVPAEKRAFSVDAALASAAAKKGRQRSRATKHSAQWSLCDVTGADCLNKLYRYRL